MGRSFVGHPPPVDIRAGALASAEPAGAHEVARDPRRQAEFTTDRQTG